MVITLESDGVLPEACSLLTGQNGEITFEIGAVLGGNGSLVVLAPEYSGCEEVETQLNNDAGIYTLLAVYTCTEASNAAVLVCLHSVWLSSV